MEQKIRILLKNEKKELEDNLRELEKSLQDAPEGKIRCAMSKGKFPQYYLSEKAEGGAKRKETYLTKDKADFVRKLVQREYDEDVRKLLSERLKVVDRILKTYQGTLTDRYDRLPEARKMLVKPLILSDEDFIKAWKVGMTTGNNTYEIKGDIYSENGEHVRSKTEKIIADILKLKGIPYVYEPALYLKNERIVVYPDFAILNLKTRETFYYEHFGMMDNPEYSTKAVQKINQYERNRFWFGKNLLYSFETKDHPVDSRLVSNMITNYCE